MAPTSFAHKLAALGALLGLILAAPATGAAAVDSQAALGIRPSDGGSYISLTLEPGSVHELSIDLGNYGDAPAQAETYAADIYSLVNGGMGVRLKGEPISGTTHWVEYLPQSLTIEPHTAVRRSVTLRVPADAQPGEYQTSIVIQGGAVALDTSGGLALEQVSRQAMAIAISVPGALRTQLDVGAASHRELSGTSLVLVELHNSGNKRISPGGTFVLLDAAGNEVSRYPIALGSIYAGTATELEVPFAGALPPGTYTVNLELVDTEAGLAAMQGTAPLVISPPADAPAPATEGGAPEPAAINLPTGAPASAEPDAQFGLSTPEIMFVGVALLVLALVLGPALRRRR